MKMISHVCIINADLNEIITTLKKNALLYKLNINHIHSNAC